VQVAFDLLTSKIGFLGAMQDTKFATQTGLPVPAASALWNTCASRWPFGITAEAHFRVNDVTPASRPAAEGLKAK
jgi:hypothetical protein